MDALTDLRYHRTQLESMAANAHAAAGSGGHTTT
jgi:hypothetical protein